MSGLRYVYAVCRPFGTPLQTQLTGIGGAPPALLRHRGLVAVVSTVPRSDFAGEALRAHLADPDWLTATTRSHQGVIDALTTVTTPLPLRLATVFPDDSGVRTMIENREDDFRNTLNRLAGRVEWGVKVYLEPEPGGPAGLAVEPTDGRGRPHRREAGTRAQEERQQRAGTFAQALHERLSQHACDVRLRTPQESPPSREESPRAAEPGRNVLDAAYLVPRTHSEEFVELVDRAKGEAPGVRVVLTGPWAAYSFTGESTAEGIKG
ncbi:gas vesicle protein [Streptomyces pluripotens]|uniref:Gas vesicle protein n=1 Tax=Streptomyces pluripotens TaxID=1355015 RepID=A0A221P5N2_9ACTN|nr:GvpL/GvpF family gas vesicle protein [Streptomyces pluripotens]ARP73174.1 gas vesicle protein [Streptomyces pluripotens]ASN27424.1 gas vesicle protein [Streptomyces pluripotens]